MKTKEVADRLGLDTSTIRVWSGRDYIDFMSESAQGGGRRRHFTERDVQVLAYVVQARDEGTLHDEIRQQLVSMRQDNWRGLPDIPPKPGHDNEVPMVPAEAASIAISKQAEKLNLQIITLEKQVDLLEEALEEERGERKQLQTQLTETKEQLGELRGQLHVVEAERKPTDYWLKIIAIAVFATLVLAAIVIAVLIATNGVG